MPTTITPAAADPNGQTYTAPADGDAITAASVNGALQKIANFIAWLRTNPVTRAQLPAVGQQISSQSGNWNTLSATYVDVTNLAVSLTVTGRPVMLLVVPGTATAASLSTSNTGTASGATFRLLRDAVSVAEMQLLAAANDVGHAASMVALDTPAAGTYTYKLQARATDPAATAWVTYMKLIAYEL